MAISGITVFHVQLPLRWSIGHATARRRSSENVFAVLEMTDGTVGFGEGLPRPYVTGETMDVCWAAFEDFDPATLCEAWPSAQGMDKALMSLTQGPNPAPSARCALELAFLDALGRASGRPAAAIVAEALGLPAPKEREVAYSAVLPFARPVLTRLLCFGAKAYGFPSVKLKVGSKTLEEEKRRLEAVRRWVGQDVELRADANGGWSIEEAAEVMDACHRARIECLEQPVSREDWKELVRRLPTPPPVALMADESVCTEEDLRLLRPTGALQAVNCRVAKMGGLIPSARIGRAALEAGLDILVGCHVGESSLLSATGRQLAALLPEARWYEGSFDKWLLAVNLAEKPLSFGRGGKARISLSPGLGVNILRPVLERISKRELTLWPPPRV